MKEAVVRAVANLLCAIIIAISIFIGFGMLWEQDQLDREQREKHHREQKLWWAPWSQWSAIRAVNLIQYFKKSVSSPEIITTPGTIQNAPKIPATFLSERTAKKPAIKPSASQEQWRSAKLVEVFRSLCFLLLYLSYRLHKLTGNGVAAIVRQKDLSET